MLLLAAADWKEWLNAWANYPGLELWKFLNLAIFAAVGILLLRGRIDKALHVRREAIKKEMLVAQEEREQALARVAEADGMLSRLPEDVQVINEQARKEAKAERKRILAATEQETAKLRQQADREMETADKLARKELRQFLATRSVEVARKSIQSHLRPEDDAALIKETIGDLRRTTV